MFSWVLHVVVVLVVSESLTQANKHLKYLHALTHIIIVVFFRNVFCSPLTILAKAQLIT